MILKAFGNVSVLLVYRTPYKGWFWRTIIPESMNFNSNRSWLRKAAWHFRSQQERSSCTRGAPKSDETAQCFVPLRIHPPRPLTCVVFPSLSFHPSLGTMLNCVSVDLSADSHICVWKITHPISLRALVHCSHGRYTWITETVWIMSEPPNSLNGRVTQPATARPVLFTAITN